MRSILEILISIQLSVSFVFSASEDESVEEEDELDDPDEDFLLEDPEDFDLEPEEDFELEEDELPLPRGLEPSVTRLPLPFPL